MAHPNTLAWIASRYRNVAMQTACRWKQIRDSWRKREGMQVRGDAGVPNDRDGANCSTLQHDWALDIRRATSVVAPALTVSPLGRNRAGSLIKGPRWRLIDRGPGSPCFTLGSSTQGCPAHAIALLRPAPRTAMLPRLIFLRFTYRGFVKQNMVGCDLDMRGI